MDNQAYQAPQADITLEKETDKQAFKLLDWKGRVGRLKYIQLSFFYPFLVSVGLIITSILSLTLFSNSPSTIKSTGILFEWLYSGLMIYWLLIWIWCSIQRIHDIDLSGWLLFFWLMPVVNLLLLIIPGTMGSNRYGKEMKEVNLFVKISAGIGVLGVVMFYWFFYLWIRFSLFWF